MIPEIYTIGNCKRQTGAVLIVALMLLILITILAISGMNTATTELAMARNAQNHEYAFQAAEAGLEQALSQGRFDAEASTNLGQIVLSSHENVTVRIDVAGTTMVPDRAFSLGVGNGIVAHHFVATARAESLRSGSAANRTDRDTTAIHTQAFYVLGAASTALSDTHRNPVAR